jgi:redox-sensitive bicupin YhaK (pirin superfamily)
MSDPNTVIRPQQRDLGGGFTVRRLLPAAAQRSVGPFVFFDHFGPVSAGPEDQHDVRPHPHIGLATVTYLFEGAMLHRDSTGAVQRIEPGAVNWMTAGRGIVHSERTPDDLRGQVRRSHGLQLWVALPAEDEGLPPSFVHTPADALPVLEVGGARLRVLVGEAFGVASPVAVRSPMLYLDAVLSAGDAIPLPLAEERAVYVVDGAVALDGVPLQPQTLNLVPPGAEPLLSASSEARVALIGGAPLGPRRLWWNFVATRPERIREAAQDWAAGRFDPVPGETEFIPLPDHPPP